MPLVTFGDLMERARRGSYAVGYFESWDVESLLAVADAAQALRSPVILGFSGIFLPHPARVAPAPLPAYAALGRAVAEGLSVPCCLLFNESPRFDWVVESARLGFGLVMFTDEGLDAAGQRARVKETVRAVHPLGAAVEAEMGSLPGVGGELTAAPEENPLTDPRQARAFVEETGVDALAVSVGQAHLHGRAELRLAQERVSELARAVSVPLVLHGASSVSRADLAEAIRRGIRKVNVGSVLKRSFFEAVRAACAAVPPGYNPYDVVGSGLAEDVLIAGRLAMRREVEALMGVFGSAGKA
jgi:fructose/tagatose bisphosphate aldolase